MSGLKNILLIIIVGLLLGSCKQYKYARYKPQPVQNTPKLVALVPVIPTEELNALNLVKSRYQSSQETVEEIIKIHKDGLIGICGENNQEFYGYYSFHMKSPQLINGGFGFYVFGSMTATVLFGVPFGNQQTQMDVEFMVYDAKKNLIAKYNVAVDPKKTKAWEGLYFSYNAKTVGKVSQVRAHKLAFEEFNKLISKDIDAINAKLKSGGKVVIEKSDVIGNANENEVYLDPGREINKEKGGGTGFLISEKGYVVTNYHVVEDARDIYLYLGSDSTNKKYKATIISEDKTNDIAVLRIDSGFVSPGKIPYTFSDDYNVSDEVFTIGYPQPDIMGSAYKYTKGEISSLSGIENNITMMQITTPLQPGNSGGPLFNKKGDIVGITTSTLNPFFIARYHGNIPQNVNYAVKSDYIKPLIKQYMDKGDNTITALPLAEQIKVLSKFTCMIKVY